MEQPGKNAITHFCQMQVHVDDDDDLAVVACGLLATLQCSECAAWICGTEGLEHANICVCCDGVYCPEHYSSHRLSWDCEQREVA